MLLEATWKKSSAVPELSPPLSLLGLNPGGGGIVMDSYHTHALNTAF